MILLNKLLNSPTLMTLGNLVVKSSSLIILLPIILTTFNEAEITVWYSCAAIISLQMLLDFGLNPTFTRYIAYGFGGAKIQDVLKGDVKTECKHDINFQNIVITSELSKLFYRRLSTISFLFALVVGSWLVYEKLLLTGELLEASLIWVFVLLTASVSLFGNRYCVVLQGFGKIALVQRIQMFSALAAILSSTIVALIVKDLYATILTFYMWNYLYIFLYKFHFSRLTIDKHRSSLNSMIINEYSRFVLNKCWKSGVGVLSSLGVIQLSSLIVVKFFSPSISSMYMISLQMIRAISSFSQAPFYSQLPKWASNYVSEKNRLNLQEEINNRVLIALLVFVVLFIIVSLSFPLLFKFINSAVQFPDLDFWLFVGAAFLVERFCSMLLQVYTISGDVIWHKLNVVTSLIMIIVSFMTFEMFGISGLPIAMLLAYMFYYFPLISLKVLKFMPNIRIGRFILVLFISLGAIYVGKN